MDYNFVEVAWPACFNYLSLLVSMGSQGKLLCTLNIKKEVSVKIYQTSRLQICVNFFPAASHWQKDRVAPKTVQLACLCINYYECQIYSDSLWLHSWWASPLTTPGNWVSSHGGCTTWCEVILAISAWLIITLGNESGWWGVISRP